MKHETDLRPLLQLRLQCSVAISKAERLCRQEDKDWEAVMNSSTSIAADYKDHADSNAQDSPPVPTSCDLQASQSEAYGQLTLQVRTANCSWIQVTAHSMLSKYLKSKAPASSHPCQIRLCD